MTTRKDDELTLEILHRHLHTDQSYAEMAAEFGMTKAAVSKRVARVREQDIKHDPDNAIPYWSQEGTPT